jgi:hypothetical protein
MELFESLLKKDQSHLRGCAKHGLVFPLRLVRISLGWTPARSSEFRWLNDRLRSISEVATPLIAVRLVEQTIMTLFEPREPDHRLPLHSKAMGVVFFLGAVAALAGVVYLLSVLMGD